MAIEGILVVHREIARPLRVVEGRRQVGEALSSIMAAVAPGIEEARIQ